VPQRGSVLCVCVASTVGLFCCCCVPVRGFLCAEKDAFLHRRAIVERIYCHTHTHTDSHTHTHSNTHTHKRYIIIYKRTHTHTHTNKIKGFFICFMYMIVSLVVFKRSTCLRSSNLYWCALIETTIVSSSITSHNHTTILYGRSL